MFANDRGVYTSDESTLFYVVHGALSKFPLPSFGGDGN